MANFLREEAQNILVSRMKPMAALIPEMAKA
jgi:hypothetical protein